MNMALDDKERNIYLIDIEYFSGLFDKDPSSMFFMPMAYAYLKLDKYDEVISACEKGLEHHSDYIPATCLLAEAFIGKGMLEEAKALLLGAVEISPYNYRARKLLGDILHDEGDMEGALEYYRVAQKLSPKNEELNTILAEIDGDFKSNFSEDDVTDVVDEELDGQIDRAMEGILDNLKDEDSAIESLDYDEVAYATVSQETLLQEERPLLNRQEISLGESEPVEKTETEGGNSDKLFDNISFQEMLRNNDKEVTKELKNNIPEQPVVSDNKKTLKELSRWLEKIDSIKNN